MDAGGLAHMAYNDFNPNSGFGTSNAAGYGSRGKATHMKRLSVAPPPNINSISEDRVDATPGLRTSRSHLLAGLRTAPKTATSASASAPYNQQHFNADALSFAGRSNARGGYQDLHTAAASHFPYMYNGSTGYGYQNSFSGQEQVQAPPNNLANGDQMDPEIYNSLMAQQIYLLQRKQQLEQQLLNVAAAQQFQGMNDHHAPATPITPHGGMYNQQALSGMQSAVHSTGLPHAYSLYNPMPGQNTTCYHQDVTSPLSPPNNTPGLSYSPDAEVPSRFFRKDNMSPPFGQGVNNHRNSTPPKGTPSPQQDVLPLPPPSANAFRPGHRKSMSHALSTSLKGMSLDGPKTAEPRTTGFPFPTRTGTFGLGLGRAGEHPIRQPRGPPNLDELVAAPTSKHEGSKNFASRQRRRAVHDLVRAGNERRTGRNGSTDSGTPSSESEINFVISSDADSEGNSSATTGSGSLSGDPTFGNFKFDKAIGSEWKELKQRSHDNGSASVRSFSSTNYKDFAAAMKKGDMKPPTAMERRKSPLLVLTSAAEKRKSSLY